MHFRPEAEWYHLPDLRIIRWWLDGRLLGDYTNVAFPPAPFTDYKVSAIWGGVVAKEAMRDQLEWITRTAAGIQVPAVSLLPSLVGSGVPTTRLYLLPYDGHPSARGYAIGAAFLADWLVSRQPLAPGV